MGAARTLAYFAGLMRRAHPGLLAHARRTALLVGMVVPCLPWSGCAPRAVYLAGAFLHDVGKVRWPPELFTKRALAPSDWSLIKAHPVMGADLVRYAWPGAPEIVLKIIREHHERPGGKGYPEGIEPCYPALVVACCEVFDAMTHDRGYREAVAAEKALVEVEKWGPAEVVRILRKLHILVQGG